MIGLYQTDFSLNCSVLFLKKKKIPPPIHLVHFTLAFMEKKSILLFYLKRQKCTYECEEEKDEGGSFAETPHDRCAFNPLSSAGRWIKYGENCTNVFLQNLLLLGRDCSLTCCQRERGKENVCWKCKGWSYISKQHY